MERNKSLKIWFYILSIIIDFIFYWLFIIWLLIDKYILWKFNFDIIYIYVYINILNICRKIWVNYNWYMYIYIVIICKFIEFMEIV